MTSQIITLNRSGVAIASDSIATITHSNGDYIATVNNAQKVFDLGPGHKILILNADSMDISGAPVATLLAAWNATLTSPMPQSFNYLENFLDWLELQEDSKFPKMEQDFRTFVYDQLRPISEAIASHFGDLRPFNEETLAAVTNDEEFASKYRRRVSREISSFLKMLDGNRVQSLIDDRHGMAEQIRRQIDACVIFEAGKIIDLWFPDAVIPKASKDKLKKNIYKIIAQVEVERNQSLCRLTFVGYGTEEIYPKVWEVGISEKFSQVTRWRGLGGAKVEKDDPPGHVYLLAQTSAIQNFLHGVHPSFLENLKNTVPLAVMDDRRDDFDDPEQFNEEEATIWRGIGQSVYVKLEDYIKQFTQTNKRELEARISYMDPKELAKVAKSLLDLEILATLNNTGPSTVGGDTVVATIDLRDGVTWISRL